MVTPGQCRAARGFLQWSREDLAAHADVAARTVVDFEREARHPIKKTLDAMREAFEDAGITFGADGSVGLAPRVHKAKKKQPR
jgi:DNA-binding XRE family transcriptional regulator